LAHATVGAYLKTAFDINALLTRFFHDPVAFRTIQARTATLISGTFALQFFDRNSRPASDLDLHVHPHHRREVGRWLLSIGYVFAPRRGQNADFEITVRRHPDNAGLQFIAPGVTGILTFYKTTEGQPLKIRIVVARRTPMEVIMGFRSTCVMNVITFERAYCIFPLATVEQHVSLPAYSSQGRSPRRAEVLNRDAEKGFDTLCLLSSTELLATGALSPFKLGPRWLGDMDTWVVPLVTEGISPPPPPNPYSFPRIHDPAVLTSFSVRYDSVEGAIMDFDIVESAVLQYSYVFGDNNTIDYVRHILAVKAWDEQYKVMVCSLDDWQ
ncbi:hypothetical protein OH77DRAFT_1414569, partial [Trametes cingulata]